MVHLLLSFLAVSISWNLGSAVNLTGCLYHEPYPLEFDAVRQPVGDIYSPGFEEGQYPSNAYCDYVIKAAPGYVIKITFLDMDVAVYKGCENDKIYVIDGPAQNDGDLGAYCGPEPPKFPVVSTKNAMRISFRTDGQINKKGFHLRYEAMLPTEICPRGQLKCRNNRCYRPEEKCNGRDECLDGSDEENCNRPLPNYECGISSIFPIESTDVTDRVVGGIEARPHSWPWQADLQTALIYPNSHHCGGTLINPQWVMTAHHCVVGSEPSYWRIHLGNHYRYKRDRYEQVRLVERIIVYPGYTDEKGMEQNVNFKQDIALLKLNAPVEITEGVRPACLPTEGYIEPVGTKCQATGWGETRGTGSHEALKQAEMYVQSEETCSAGQREFHICLDSRKGLQGVCHGDSGGPVACKIDGKWHVLGISSFVTKTNFLSGLCAVNGGMSVYNRVSNKISWIEKIVQQYS